MRHDLVSSLDSGCGVGKHKGLCLAPNAKWNNTIFPKLIRSTLNQDGTESTCAITEFNSIWIWLNALVISLTFSTISCQNRQFSCWNSPKINTVAEICKWHKIVQRWWISINYFAYHRTTRSYISCSNVCKCWFIMPEAHLFSIALTFFIVAFF